jgi:hypothetical protein
MFGGNALRAIPASIDTRLSTLTGGCDTKAVGKDQPAAESSLKELSISTRIVYSKISDTDGSPP